MPASRPPELPSAEALFRFRVIGEVLTEQMRGRKRTRAVAVVAAREHLTLDGRSRTVSRRTLFRWLKRYEETGRCLGALEPRARTRVAVSTVLPDALVDFIRHEKTQDPRASTPDLIERARERGVLAPEQPVDRTTVWRAIRRMGLPTRQRPTKHEGDTRRFAYPHRMQMVLCDGKKFRAGAERLRRVALFFIDDSTRTGLHVVVGTEETTELFLRGLFGLLMRRGWMDAIYLDKGPGFRSDDTAAVLGQLAVPLILGRTRYPEGHGKIERFHQTAIRKVLRGFDGAADVDPDHGALELRLSHYLGRYNDRLHESLDGDTPRMRWDADPRPLRFADDEATLRSRFVVTEERRVSNDHVIQFDGVDYEAPRGLARQRVLVHRRLLDGADDLAPEHLSVLHDGRLVRLHPVDLAANARARRGTSRSEPLDEVAPVKTAATVAFERDYGSLVGPDGGFSDKE